MGDLAHVWKAFQLPSVLFRSRKQVKIQYHTWTSISEHVLCENTSIPSGRVTKSICSKETLQGEKTKLGT